MGIFRRIADNFRAGVNKAIDEAEDPEALIDQAIRDKETALNSAKSSSADVFGNVHRLEKELVEAKSNITAWEDRIKVCVEKGNDEKANEAIIKLNDVVANVTRLENSYKSAVTMANSLKKSLTGLEEDLTDLRNKRNGLVARYKTAQAAEKVNEITANIQGKGNTISLDRLERKIVEKESRAEGLADLKVTSLEDEIDELNKTSVADQLAAYKNKYKA